MWLPDTNFWIEILKRPEGVAASRFRQCKSADLQTSVIVWAELLHGAKKYGVPERRKTLIHRMLNPFICHQIGRVIVNQYAKVRHNLELRGQVIGPFDMLLAATALAHNLTLVTNNTDEFKRVPSLKIEDWSKA